MSSPRARASPSSAATRWSTSRRRRIDGQGNSVSAGREDRPHHLPPVRPPLLPPAEGRLRLLRLRRFAPTPRLRLGEAPVTVQLGGRGRETASSPWIANRNGRSLARRIPTRGPTTTARGRRARGTKLTRRPRVASSPSSPRWIPKARQSRPGPEAIAGSPLGKAPARRSTACPGRVTRFAQTTWWIR